MRIAYCVHLYGWSRIRSNLILLRLHNIYDKISYRSVLTGISNLSCQANANANNIVSANSKRKYSTTREKKWKQIDFVYVSVFEYETNLQEHRFFLWLSKNLQRKRKHDNNSPAWILYKHVFIFIQKVNINLNQTVK